MNSRWKWFLWHRVMSFEAGKVYSFLVGYPPLGRLKSATVSWTYWSSVFNPLTWRLISIPALHINRIIILNLETNARVVICGNDEAIQSGKEVRMLPQPGCRLQSNLMNTDDVESSNNFLEHFGRKKYHRKKKIGMPSSMINWYLNWNHYIQISSPPFEWIHQPFTNHLFFFYRLTTEISQTNDVQIKWSILDVFVTS